MSDSLRVTGKAEVDLRPVNGATMLAWAGLARLTEATEAVEIMEEEAMFFSLLTTVANNTCNPFQQSF